MGLPRPLALASAIVALASALPAAQAGPALDEVLRRTGAYLAAYLDEVSSVVAEEEYLQRATSLSDSRSRRLRSDLAILLDDRAGWVAFRDVFEVDGEAVRDRQDRLTRLFVAPRSDAAARVREIVAESSRYNLNTANAEVARTINTPVTALRFLMTGNQARSAFRVDSVNRQGRSFARLRFTERGQPRLIRTPDNAAASGHAIVAPDSGAVVETGLEIHTGSVQATFRTTYAAVKSFGVLLPQAMDETYVMFLRSAAVEATRIEGRAVYSNFRSFRVSVDVDTGSR